MPPSTKIIQLFKDVPPFVGKLWKLVNDPKTNHIISWNQVGNGFIIHNKDTFSSEVPLYFRLYNFVQELYFYGFKVVSTDGTAVQYEHRYFRRNKSKILKYIKCRATKSDSAKRDELSILEGNINRLRMKYSNFISQLTAVKNQNVLLWKEIVTIKNFHCGQRHVFRKMIKNLDDAIKLMNSTMHDDDDQVKSSAYLKKLIISIGKDNRLKSGAKRDA